jgi:hypothetical protein
MSFIINPSTGGGSTPPGGSTTQIQYNNAGAFAGNANLTFNGSTVLGVPNVIRALTQPMTIAGKIPTSSSDGGQITILGTNGFAGSSASGSDVQIITGNGPLSGNGGIFSVAAGTSNSGTGGAIDMRAGNSFSGSGGEVFISTGAGAVSGGTLTLLTGAGSGSSGGFLNIGVGSSANILSAAMFGGVSSCTFYANQIGFFGVTAISRPTTADPSSAFTAGIGVSVQDVSTFDGYTIAQVVSALRRLGFLT